MTNTILSACIVTYNNAQTIEKAIESLLSIPNISPKAIHIVDNCSTDQTLSLIEKKFPSISLHPLDENIGFGQGHNQILPFLNSDYHMVVNPDISFDFQEISKMVSYMEKKPSVVALSPKVLFPNGKEQFLPKELPSFRYLAGGFFENHALFFANWRKEYTWQNKIITSPTKISFATGCFMFLSTKAFLQVNGFDPRYFLYMEDIDLTRELSKIGDVIYHPDIVVTHHWARSSAINPKSRKLHFQALWQYVKKWGLPL